MWHMIWNYMTLMEKRLNKIKNEKCLNRNWILIYLFYLVNYINIIFYVSLVKSYYFLKKLSKFIIKIYLIYKPF